VCVRARARARRKRGGEEREIFADINFLNSNKKTTINSSI